MLKKPELKQFADLKVELGDIRPLGEGRLGTRRIIPITSGTFEGADIRGKILNLGADWQTVSGNGLAILDTRYALETDDGASIEIINYGFRHGPPETMEALAKGEDVSPDDYYMRTHARLETGHDWYSWVNKMLFIGTGSRSANAVHMTLFAIT